MFLGNATSVIRTLPGVFTRISWENWFSYFDKEKFLILTTEDFRENSQRTLDQVFDFLEVPPFQLEDLRDHNVGKYKPMNEDTRKFLIKYYKPHNERLSKLLQRSFHWDR